MSFNGSLLERRLSNAVGKEHARFVAASRIAIELLGDSIGANFVLVGYALQWGVLPLSADSIERAIELNGVAVDLNKRALRLGRLWAHDPARLSELWGPEAGAELAFPQTAEKIQEHREALLRDYQDARYAARYTRLVEQVRRAEATRTPGRSELTTAVARYFAKLMAYKDEYEVARLHTSGEFERKLRAQFSGDFKLRFNLAPPLFARRDPATGHLLKREFGGWMRGVFKILASLRGLRGTALDPFGRTIERRRERAWIDRYEGFVREICESLDMANHAAAVELASIPEQIRGYGHVKEQRMREAERRAGELLASLKASPPTLSIPEPRRA
jgi:indolepyruvate ferredoxin oxidoreductase